MRNLNDPWEISQDKPPSTLDGAVLFLKNWMTQKTGRETAYDEERPLIDVVREMIERNPEQWWLGHHFGWGMSMRNLLRSNGYGEADLGIKNLDDHYVQLIEKACLKN